MKGGGGCPAAGRSTTWTPHPQTKTAKFEANPAGGGPVVTELGKRSNPIDIQGPGNKVSRRMGGAIISLSRNYWVLNMVN